MKVLLGTMLVILMVGSAQAEVICEKKRGRWYPKNETAQKIASSLGVKTCNGHRFKEVVKGIGEKSNVPATKSRLTSKELIAQMKQGQQQAKK